MFDPNNSTVQEFGINQIHVNNLEYFFSIYSNQKGHKTAFGVLYELEYLSVDKDTPEKMVMISYSDDASCIFILKEIKIENNTRIVVYEFNGTVS